MKFVAVNEAAVVIRRRGQVLLRQCAEGERWAGLWDFPRFELDSEGPLFVQKELAVKVRAQTGVTSRAGRLLTTMKHGVTRFRITLDCYEATYVSGRIANNGTRSLRWSSLAELAELPLSTTGRKLANFITHKPK